MIKLFSLKQEKEAEAASSAAGEKKVAPGLLRMQKGGPRRPSAAMTVVEGTTRTPRRCTELAAVSG